MTEDDIARAHPVCLFGEGADLLFVGRWRDTDEEAIAVAQRKGVVLPPRIVIRRGTAATRYQIDETGHATKIEE